MKKDNLLYFSDFIPKKIFNAGSIKITKTDIINYAEKFDPQFFHLDEESAKDSIFGGLVASGWHTASLSMRLFVTACGNIRGGIVGREVANIQWPRPTYPNDELSITCEVIDARVSKTRPDLGIVKIKNTTRNQNNHTVMIADIVMFVSIEPK